MLIDLSHILKGIWGLGSDCRLNKSNLALSSRVVENTIYIV